jgi:hypothetical protein
VDPTRAGKLLNAIEPNAPRIMPERLIALITLIVLVVIPVGVTLSKRLWVEFFLGCFLPGVWIIGSFRLARPSSWWARRFYGPETMQRAESRFGVKVPTAS